MTIKRTVTFDLVKLKRLMNIDFENDIRALLLGVIKERQNLLIITLYGCPLLAGNDSSLISLQESKLNHKYN